MRLDEGERVASIERLIDPEDTEIAEGAAPEVTAEDGDTVPVDMGEVVEDEDEGEDDGGDDE
jgi:hypothetical protein